LINWRADADLTVVNVMLYERGGFQSYSDKVIYL